MNEIVRQDPIPPQPVFISGPPIGAIDIPGQGLKRDYAGLLEYWQMIRRHKGAVIVATLLGGVGGFLMTLSEARVYQAQTSLEIQGLNEEFLNMKSVNPVSSAAGAFLDTDIQTQVKLLQSGSLLSRVHQKLDARPHPDDLQPPDRLGVWRKALNIDPPTSDELWARALGTAAGGVRVRNSGTTRIVDVSCESTSGEVAADFCNTLAQEYIDQNLEARWKSTEYTGQWLTKQLQDLKINLEKQEEELQAYARATGLMFTDEKNNVQQTTLVDLQKELSTAQADRIVKQSTYEMTSSSPAGAIPDVLNDAALKGSQDTLEGLQAKLAQLNVTFTPSHVEVRRVQAQISAIETSLERARANVLTRVRKEFEAAQRRESLLASAYADQARLLSGEAEETAHYNLLKRDVDATRLLYETLLQRLKEASIATALRANNIRVVDPADTPSAPYKPYVQREVTVGLFFGLALGIGFAVFRERSDRTLQDPGDAAHYLGLPELGVVPVGNLLEATTRRSSARSPTVALDSGVEMISFRQKTSLLAESFRTTLTSILYSRRNGGRPRVLVLTSASPKEGKTTVVSNLGIALAEINHSVLLIDGDMRKPRLHSVFGSSNDLGLSDLLLQKAPLDALALDAACSPSDIPNLTLLCAGGSRSSASTLLHSGRLEEVLKLARARYDTVIIDTPPMVNIADARVFARFADALIFVVRSGSTTRDAALLAKSRFLEDGIPILGTILNAWNPKTPGYGYYHSYYAGYYHYYGDGDDKGDGGDDGGLFTQRDRESVGPRRTPRSEPHLQFFTSVDDAIAEIGARSGAVLTVPDAK